MQVVGLITKWAEDTKRSQRATINHRQSSCVSGFGFPSSIPIPPCVMFFRNPALLLLLPLQSLLHRGLHPGLVVTLIRLPVEGKGARAPFILRRPPLHQRNVFAEFPAYGGE